MKHSWLVVLVLGSVACSGSVASQATSDDGGAPPSSVGDPPAMTPGTVGTDPSGDGGAASPAPATGDASSPSSPPPQDDGGGAPPPPPSAGGVFADAGAYVPTLGPSARNPKHAGNPNPAGQACLSCHGGQRPNIVQFLFAGTVWSSAAATTPTPQAEVRVVQANGAALSAYSDADGNFFFLRSASPPLDAPVAGGVRDSNGAALMVNVFNVGDCNSCHHSGGEAPVNLP
jgi:hypothetical protein